MAIMAALGIMALMVSLGISAMGLFGIMVGLGIMATIGLWSRTENYGDLADRLF